MLYEEGNLVTSEKELKLQVFINQLINDLYNNKKIEVDSEKLLELLSYLTSDETISTQMKSCVEVQNRRITDILHKREVEHLKKYIEYLKENSIQKQRVKDKIEEYEEDIKEFKQTDNTGRFKRENCILLYKKEALEELLEDK